MHDAKVCLVGCDRWAQCRTYWTPPAACVCALWLIETAGHVRLHGSFQQCQRNCSVSKECDDKPRLILGPGAATAIVAIGARAAAACANVGPALLLDAGTDKQHQYQ